MPDDPKDDIYRDPCLGPVEDFAFDQQVTQVFPDMIQRSVPGYATVVNMTGVLAGQYVTAGSHSYDLGCSLGASAFSMAAGIAAQDCRILAIDSSSDMIAKARNLPHARAGQVPIDWICDDVMNTEIVNASMVVLNFTLQFIPVQQRLKLLCNIRQGLLPGGVLVVSEKLSFTDTEEEALQIDMHHAFKRANGYNDLEISRKRNALERVLLPETLAQHQARLQEAGFRRTDLWFQCFNFVSLVARP